MKVGKEAVRLCTRPLARRLGTHGKLGLYYVGNPLQIKIVLMWLRSSVSAYPAYAAPVYALLKSAQIGSIPCAISSTDQFLLPVSLILAFVHHKLYSKIPRRSCACQNRLGPGRVNSPLSLTRFGGLSNSVDGIQLL